MAPLAGPEKILELILPNLLFLQNPPAEKLSGKNPVDSLLEPMRALAYQIKPLKNILIYHRTTATGREARQENDEVVLHDQMITINEK